MTNKHKCQSCISRRELLKLAGLSAGAVACSGFALPTFAQAASTTHENAQSQEGSGIAYRTISRVDLRLSTVGIGGGNLVYAPTDEIRNVISLALDYGINYIDMLLSPEGIEHVLRAVQGKRNKLATQMHIGALYRNGQYTRSRNLRLVRENTEQMLKMAGGYTDIALLHYIDQEEDFERVMQEGLFDYAQQLKKEGKIRALGCSTHSIDIAQKFMATGNIDVYMFSINPSYDFAYSDGKLVYSSERAALYQESARNNVGILCMKTYGGGRLLNAASSPFGRAMTPSQCIQYCLDRPAVVSCPVGIGSVQDMQSAIAYYSSSKEERSYGFIGELQGQDVKGDCVYCNHCLPCPAGIDIGLAMKYYDLARVGDVHARDHYQRMPKGAADCIYCDACEKNCPFGVPIMNTMREMTAYFAKA